MRLRHFAPVVVLVACGTTDDAPTDHLQARETHLAQYQTCDDLERDLKDMLVREAWANIDMANTPRYGWGVGEGDSSGATPTGGAGGGSGSGRTEGVDYSGTNNQVNGVDEADNVKTDGYHIYNLNGNRLHIFGVPNFGDLVPESVTNLEGHPTQMLVDGTSGRAVVFSMIDVWRLPDGHPLKQLVGWQDDVWYWRIPEITKLTVLDISDRTHPTLVREVYFEGWYQTARKIGTTVRMAAYSSFDRPEMYDWWREWDASEHDVGRTKAWVRNRIDGLHLSDLIPQMYVRTPDGQFVTNSLSQGQCQSFYRPSDSHARGISTIISLDMLGTDFFWDADHVVSNWPTFYESDDHVVLAESAHDWWWYWWYADDDDQMNVHIFDGSVAGTTSYIASGRVDGQIVDQFSLDETNGAIRIAATTGAWERWWTGKAPNPENHLYVIEPTGEGGHAPIIGRVDGINKGERIMSSRMQGNRGFLVTYKYTDPLITLDLSDNRNPKIVGELKVPGFSTYLQPIGDSKLLSIGYEGNPTWNTDVSMYDVSNFATPSLDTMLPLVPDNSQTWTWSEATWDHHAFQYWGPKQLLAIPSSNWTYNNATGYYGYLSKLQLIRVDPTTGLSMYGSVDHSQYYNEDQSRWWSLGDIRRSIFMGDYVYAISDKAITSHRVTDLGTVNVGRLPGYDENDWWWWW
jgi:hypothetical protein